jgi:hypothetical protein
VRRIVAIVAIAVGAALTGVPLVFSLFDRTGDAERILDRFEFLTLDDNPARYLRNAETTRTGSTELVDEAAPSFASDLGLSQSEFDARFSSLATARKKIPDTNDFSLRYSKQLDAVDEQFQPVYDIPTSSLPLTATPWLLLVVGLLCLAAGLVVLRTASRASIVAILALGAGMAIGLLVLSAPGKASDGEDVKDFASRGLTPRAAAQARQASQVLDASVRETNQELLPALARRKAIPGAQLDEELRRSFPAAEKFLGDWEVLGPRLSRLADAVEGSVDEFESAEKMPITFPVWLALGAGAAMSLFAGIALTGEGRPRS